jgi:hypothetical protein
MNAHLTDRADALFPITSGQWAKAKAEDRRHEANRLGRRIASASCIRGDSLDNQSFFRPA